MGQGKKIAKLGIAKKPGWLYFVRSGRVHGQGPRNQDVWQGPEVPGLEISSVQSAFYYVDSDGDVCAYPIRRRRS